MGAISEIPMILLCTSVLLGAEEKRVVNFKRSSQRNGKFQNKRNILQCAFSCSLEERCLSFRAYADGTRCMHLTKACGVIFEDGHTCYYKKVCLNTSCSLHRDAGGRQKSGGSRQTKGNTIFNHLLIIDHMTLKPVHKLDLESGKILEYPNLKWKRIRALTYMPLSRKLLLCAEMPPIVMTMALDTGEESNVTRTPSEALGVDESERLIFLIQVKTRKCLIYKMDMNSKHERLVSHGRNERPFNLVVDVDKKRLYVSMITSIKSMNYRGADCRHIVKSGRSMYPLGLHQDGHTLFYVDNRQLMKTDLLHPSEQKMAPLKFLARNLVCYRDDIYIGSDRAAYEVKDVNLEPSISKLDVHISDTSLVCLVP